MHRTTVAVAMTGFRTSCEVQLAVQIRSKQPSIFDPPHPTLVPNLTRTCPSMPLYLLKHYQRCLQMVPDFTGLQVLGKHSSHTFRQVRQTPQIPQKPDLCSVARTRVLIHTQQPRGGRSCRSRSSGGLYHTAFASHCRTIHSVLEFCFELLRTSINNVRFTCTMALKDQHGIKNRCYSPTACARAS